MPKNVAGDSPQSLGRRQDVLSGSPFEVWQSGGTTLAKSIMVKHVLPGATRKIARHVALPPHAGQLPVCPPRFPGSTRSLYANGRLAQAPPMAIIALNSSRLPMALFSPRLN